MDNTQPLSSQNSRFVTDTPKTPYSTRVIAGIILAILVIGALTIAWIFTRETRTIELSENGTYQFKNYTLTLGKITRNICPERGPVNCEDNQKQPSVQVRVQRAGDTSIDYEYLAPGSRTRFTSQELDVELLSLDFGKKSVRLKLTRK